MNYQEQLKQPEWYRKRLSILLCARFKCEFCGHDNPNQLIVHHKRYINGKKAWEYDREDLMCLCKECHYKIHRYDLKQKRFENLKISNII